MSQGLLDMFLDMVLEGDYPGPRAGVYLRGVGILLLMYACYDDNRTEPS